MKQSDHHHHHHPIPSAILDKGEQSNIYISGSWQQLFQCQQNCQYYYDHQKHWHHRPHNHHKKRWKAILFKQIIRLIMWKCTALCRESISKIVSARAFHFKHFPGHFQNVSFQTFSKCFNSKTSKPVSTHRSSTSAAAIGLPRMCHRRFEAPVI